MSNRKLKLTLHDATNDMDDEALLCRAEGHLWQRYELSEAELRRQLAEGYFERRSVCDRGCGVELYVLKDAITHETVRRTYTFPKEGYKMPPGGGRLRRAEASKAQFVRAHPRLVSAR